MDPPTPTPFSTFHDMFRLPQIYSSSDLLFASFVHSARKTQRANPDILQLRYPKIDIGSALGNRGYLPRGMNNLQYSDALSSSQTHALITSPFLTSKESIDCFRSTLDLYPAQNIFCLFGMPISAYLDSPMKRKDLIMHFQSSLSLFDDPQIGHKIVAVGKTGLDIKSPILPSDQELLLDLHLSLAKEKNLPILISNYYREKELFQILANYPDLTYIIDRPWKSDLLKRFVSNRLQKVYVELSIDLVTHSLTNKRIAKYLQTLDPDQILISTESPWKPDPLRESLRSENSKTTKYKYSTLPNYHAQIVAVIASILGVPIKNLGETIYLNTLDAFPLIKSSLIKKFKLPHVFDKSGYHKFLASLDKSPNPNHLPSDNKKNVLFDCAALGNPLNIKNTVKLPTLLKFISAGNVSSKQSLHAYLEDIGGSDNHTPSGYESGYSDTLLPRIGLQQNLRTFIGIPSFSAPSDWDRHSNIYLEKILKVKDSRVAGVGPLSIHLDSKDAKICKLQTSAFSNQTFAAFHHHIPLWINYSSDFHHCVREIIVNRKNLLKKRETEKIPSSQYDGKYSTFNVFSGDNDANGKDIGFTERRNFINDPDFYPPLLFSHFPFSIPLSLSKISKGPQIYESWFNLINSFSKAFFVISPEILQHDTSKLEKLVNIDSSKLLLMSLSEPVWFNIKLKENLSSSSDQLLKVVYFLSKIRQQDPFDLMDHLENNALTIFGPPKYAGEIRSQ